MLGDLDRPIGTDPVDRISSLVLTLTTYAFSTEHFYISGTLTGCRHHQAMIVCVIILALLSLLVATEPEG